jgi:outer membrane protein
MVRGSRWWRPGKWLVILVCLGLVGCESSPRDSTVIAARRGPRVGPQDNPSSDPTQPEAGGSASARGDAIDVPSRLEVPTENHAERSAEIFTQIPDPDEMVRTLDRERDIELALIDERPLTEEERRMERASVNADFDRLIHEAMAKLKPLAHEKRVEITLADAIHKALRHNYYLQVHAYNPAIEATRIVEAEAQFDALFFTRFQIDKEDRPTASQLQSGQTNVRTWDVGIRKMLSTGAQVSVSYALTRSDIDLMFITLNPSYLNNLIFEIRQPLLRGFGLDFNRAQIELYKIDRQIQMERFRSEIRETIFNVEQAYWQLYQARRRLAVEARLLTNLETILEWLTLRKDAGYDVYGVQLNQTRSRIEQEQAVYIQRIRDIRNAEDQLKALLNDPDLNLALDQEIIPIDAPLLEPLAIDHVGELAAALAHRSELHEARHLIEQTRLAIGVSKNQALPKLDVLFRYLVSGLGGSWGSAWSQMVDRDFDQYIIALDFEWPIGNRGPEAAVRRARLQQAQAIAGHRAQIENILREVKQAIRDLQTSYDQIGPALRAAEASQEQLRATRARMERLDPPSLQVEPDAHQALAASRNGLLQVLTSYNVALVNLERVKGTLLEYNNIAIRGEGETHRQVPYRVEAR